MKTTMRLSSILLLLGISIGAIAPAYAADSLACSELARIERAAQNALFTLESVQRAERRLADDGAASQQLEFALSSLYSEMESLVITIASASKSCDRPRHGGSPEFGKKALAVAAGVLLVAALNEANKDSGPNRANTAYLQDTTKQGQRAPTLKTVAGNRTIPTALIAGIPQYATVNHDHLSDGLVVLLADIIGCQTTDIHTLRWGESMAPEGHAMWDTTWFTVYFSEDLESRPVTLHTNAEGMVLLRQDR
jgi:hypothetical protein